MSVDELKDVVEHLRDTVDALQERVSRLETKAQVGDADVEIKSREHEQYIHGATIIEGLDVTSTRSYASVDSHRDFDGFNVNEELRRLRGALVIGDATGRSIVQAAMLLANIEEWLERGGALPERWRAAGSKKQGR